MSRWLLGLCVVLGVLNVSESSASADSTLTADDVVAKVDAKYAGATDFSAQFEQIVTNKTFGRTATSVGTVELSRPGKFRFDYEKTVDAASVLVRSFISDGRFLWTVDHGAREITRSAAPQSPPSLAFIMGGAMAGRFTASLDESGTHGSKGDVVIALKPRQPGPFKTLFLVVDSSTFEVAESIVIDLKDNTNRFLFKGKDATNPVDGARLSPAEFWKRGYSLRSQGSVTAPRRKHGKRVLKKSR